MSVCLSVCSFFFLPKGLHMSACLKFCLPCLYHSLHLAFYELSLSFFPTITGVPFPQRVFLFVSFSPSVFLPTCLSVHISTCCFGDCLYLCSFNLAVFFTLSLSLSLYCISACLRHSHYLYLFSPTVVLLACLFRLSICLCFSLPLIRYAFLPVHTHHSLCPSFCLHISHILFLPLFLSLKFVNFSLTGVILMIGYKTNCVYIRCWPPFPD
jgi:hypothetical protein